MANGIDHPQWDLWEAMWISSPAVGLLMVPPCLSLQGFNNTLLPQCWSINTIICPCALGLIAYLVTNSAKRPVCEGPSWILYRAPRPLVFVTCVCALHPNLLGHLCLGGLGA